MGAWVLATFRIRNVDEGLSTNHTLRDAGTEIIGLWADVSQESIT